MAGSTGSRAEGGERPPKELAIGAIDQIDLHEATLALERLDACEAQLADLRVFAGLGVAPQCSNAFRSSSKVHSSPKNNPTGWRKASLIFP